MDEKWVQHIGDDQLVHGLPKHMKASEGENESWWIYVPKPNACAKCLAMKDLRFAEKPGPVHPNCNCEIRQEAAPRVIAYGTLQGFEENATERFKAGQKITVEIRNLGPFGAGARLRIDRERWEATSLMAPGRMESFVFTKFGEPPVPWEVFLIYLGGDNSTLQYFIWG